MGFEKGNKAAVGARGNHLSIRQDMSTISRSIMHKLGEMDPKTKLRNIDVIANVLVENAKNGDLQAAKEIMDRTEGKAIDRIALHNLTDKPVEHFEMVHRDMSPADAARAYQKMLRSTGDAEFVMTPPKPNAPKTSDTPPDEQRTSGRVRKMLKSKQQPQATTPAEIVPANARLPDNMRDVTNDDMSPSRALVPVNHEPQVKRRSALDDDSPLMQWARRPIRRP